MNWLLAQEHDGNWEAVPSPTGDAWDSPKAGQWGGLTGIAAYALLSAGENPREPQMQQAVQFLDQQNMRGVYAMAMRAQIWPLLPPSAKVQRSAQRDANLLISGAKLKGDVRGLWFYYLDQPDDLRADNSASQLAVLGVWACSEAGAEIPYDFWHIEDQVWRSHQAADGGWSYIYNCTSPESWGQSTLSMTAAGLATLFITRDEMTSAARVGCAGNPSDRDIERGMKLVADRIPGDWDGPPTGLFIPNIGDRRKYLLFALARLGIASGYRYFGTHDWFKEGMQFLLKNQHADGSFGDGETQIWETAFAILFLSRGGAPVVYNKLNYASDPADKTQVWNERPRDVANVTRWMGNQLERRLNWEIVDINSNPLDWLDAPVLYMSGNNVLKLNAAQKAKIKEFIEDGGMVLGNADCGNPRFAKAFTALGAALFPEYEFRELPADHPIFKRQQFPASHWHRRINLLGMSNGVRELMLLIPEQDLGRIWEIGGGMSHPEAFEAAANIFQYITPVSKLHFKEDSYFTVADPSLTATRTVKIARLQYAGNWDPEPGGWRRLANILHNSQQVDLDVEPVNLGDGKLTAAFPIAHLTGTSKFRLGEAARAELKAYISGGGALLVDAAGGSDEFSIAIQAELARTFPGVEPQPMDFNAPLLSAPVEARKISFRKFAAASVGASDAPAFTVYAIGGRQAVIVSRYDLSAGIMGSDVDGVIGYTPASATALMTDMILGNAK